MINSEKIIKNIIHKDKYTKEKSFEILSKRVCPECGTPYRKVEQGEWFCTNCNKPMYGA